MLNVHYGSLKCCCDTWIFSCVLRFNEGNGKFFGSVSQRVVFGTESLQEWQLLWKGLTNIISRSVRCLGLNSENHVVVGYGIIVIVRIDFSARVKGRYKVGLTAAPVLI